MIKAAFTGEGMSSGFMGMGMGTFLGFTVADWAQRRRQPFRRGPDGAEQEGRVQYGRRRFSRIQFDKDGSMSQSMEFEVKESGVNGKVKMKTRMSACPDADGKVTVDIEVDSQMSVRASPAPAALSTRTISTSATWMTTPT